MLHPVAEELENPERIVAFWQSSARDFLVLHNSPIRLHFYPFQPQQLFP